MAHEGEGHPGPASRKSAIEYVDFNRFLVVILDFKVVFTQCSDL